MHTYRSTYHGAYPQMNDARFAWPPPRPMQNKFTPWSNWRLFSLLIWALTAPTALGKSPQTRPTGDGPVKSGFFFGGEGGLTLATNHNVFKDVESDCGCKEKYADSYLIGTRGGWELSLKRFVLDLGLGLIYGQYTAESTYPAGKITAKMQAMDLVPFSRVGFRINPSWAVLAGTDHDIPLADKITVSSASGTLTTSSFDLTPNVRIALGGRWGITPVVRVDATYYLALGGAFHGYGFSALTIGGSYAR